MQDIGTSVMQSLVAALATHAKNQFIRKTRQLEAVQEKFLFTHLAAHRDTEWGQRFQIGEIKTIDQFRDRLPILPYSSYEADVERIANGEPNVLNPEPVVYINSTSGSTGNKKLVPITRRFQAILRQANFAALGFALEGLRQRQLNLGKLLITNSIATQGLTAGGIRYGPVSVGALRMERVLVERFFANPYKALEIPDTLTRHYLCLLFALRDPATRGLIANFPMLILRTCTYLERYAESLIEDLERGTIAPWLNLDSTARAALEQRWSAYPQRAAQLRQRLRSQGKLTPKLAWPELSLVITSRGGTSDFYLQRFPDYFGNTPVFGSVFGTAEATFSIYHQLDDDGSILAIDGGFFEFIPQDQWDVEQPKTLLPQEVKPGHYYRILVTTYSGFYRYDIGDVIEVVGFYEQTPLIVFRHRRGGLLSATTEKTTEFHVIQVMQQLQQEWQIRLEDFCVTLSEHEFPARYLVNIELAPGYHLSDPQAFLVRFEELLRQVNSMYAMVRADQVPPPRLRILAPQSFAGVRQRQVNRGMFDSQLKIPHITEDRQFLAGLLVQQEVDLLELALYR